MPTPKASQSEKVMTGCLYALSHMYMEEFAAPLIGHGKGKHTVIVAVMPKNYKKLGKETRQKNEAIKREKETITRDLVAVGWTCESRKYTIEKWARPLVTDIIKPDGRDIPGTNVYIDVVSQQSAIKKVLDYLTDDNLFQSIDEREALSHYYVEEFKAKLIELLQKNDVVKGCSWEFLFVTDKEELRNALNGIVK